MLGNLKYKCVLAIQYTLILLFSKSLFIKITSLTIFSIIIFSSCKFGINMPDLISNGRDISITLNENNFFAVTNREVIFMNRTNVVWGHREESKDDDSLINFHIERENNRKSYIINDVAIDFGGIAFDANNKYFLSMILNKDDTLVNQIMEFKLNNYMGRDIDNFERVIKASNFEFAPFADMHYSNEQLILLEPKLFEGIFEYNISIIGLETQIEEIIISKLYNTLINIGEIISTIFVYEDNIFVYRILVETNNTYYYIDKYNFLGEKLKSYLLDIEDFLYIEEVNDEDFVYKMYKQNNYLFLQTINNRSAILEIKNDQVILIDTPNELETLGGSNMLSYVGWQSDVMYFLNLQNKNYVIIFNSLTSEFSLLKIYIDDAEDTLEDEITNIYRDKFGNLIVQKRVDEIKMLQQRTLHPGNFTGDSFGLNGESYFYYVNFSIIGLN